MAAGDAALGSQSDPCEYVAPEALDQRNSFGHAAGAFPLSRRLNRAGRQLAKDLLDDTEALLDFTDADPNPGVYVAATQGRDLEMQSGIGGVSGNLSGVDSQAEQYR